MLTPLTLMLMLTKINFIVMIIVIIITILVRYNLISDLVFINGS